MRDATPQAAKRVLRRGDPMKHNATWKGGLATLLLGWLAMAGCAKTTTARLGLPELRTVPRVDIERYLGTWYDIASFPQRFQLGCTGTTATYSIRADGEINVLNRCRKGSLTGKEDSAQGRARVVDRTTNAKLKVSFFRPFWGDYWIIDLGANYEYAVVGHPSRDYLWILSRNPTMEDTAYAGILGRLRAQGYEVERLNRTPQ
jgi:apolipoprotein D and lipocalin family protein